MRIGGLFSGIGGIELGFAQAGFDIAWSIEKDFACSKTFRENFPTTPLYLDNIVNLSTGAFSEVDILTAGFPCQPFSIAGMQRGFSDSRGNLFFQVIRFADALKPRFIFLENVANLLEHDNGKTFLTIHNELSALGYCIRYRVLRSSEYGLVPQIRDRIYIVAFLDWRDCEHFVFPQKIAPNTGIEDVLKRSNAKHPIYYYREDDSFYHFIKDIVIRKDCIYRVYHNSVKPTMNHMCPTLTASMGIKKNQVPLVADHYGIRKLTVSECLAFQGFPNSFHFPHTITLEDAYKQIGNSVTVPLIKRIAEQIRSTTERSK